MSDTASQTANRSGNCYSQTNPTLRHARTDAQSESESRPINRTSPCGKVTGNSLKYYAA